MHYFNKYSVFFRQNTQNNAISKLLSVKSFALPFAKEKLIQHFIENLLQPSGTPPRHKLSLKRNEVVHTHQLFSSSDSGTDSEKDETMQCIRGLFVVARVCRSPSACLEYWGYFERFSKNHQSLLRQYFKWGEDCRHHTWHRRNRFYL